MIFKNIKKNSENSVDPGRINTKKITPRHMMIKLLKSKEKERILKAEKDVTLQRRIII